MEHKTTLSYKCFLWKKAVSRISVTYVLYIWSFPNTCRNVTSYYANHPYMPRLNLRSTIKYILFTDLATWLSWNPADTRRWIKVGPATRETCLNHKTIQCPRYFKDNLWFIRAYFLFKHLSRATNLIYYFLNCRPILPDQLTLFCTAPPPPPPAIDPTVNKHFVIIHSISIIRWPHNRVESGHTYHCLYGQFYGLGPWNEQT